MAFLSKSLLGKTKRAIVVNGKLLRKEGCPVLAFVSEYRTMYALAKSSPVDLPEERGDAWIVEAVNEFHAKYGHLFPSASESEMVQCEQYVDAFTGAIIIESKEYKALIDKDVHRVGVQHSRGDLATFQQFMAEYTYNYLENFMVLLSRRIAARHLPVVIRSHFVAGLFQPLIVETPALRSPLSFGENEWFLHMLSSDEKYLERARDSSRKLDLSCIAMCDIAATFRCSVVRELDRRQWMMMVVLILLSQSDYGKTLVPVLTKEYSGLFGQLMKRNDTAAMFATMVSYVNTARSGVQVI